MNIRIGVLEESLVVYKDTRHEYDVVTDRIIAQVKRTYSSIDNPKNFLSKSTRTQIKKTIELAEEQGKEAQFWFKYGVSPKVREYIESKGGKVILGMGN
ncbi:restriction endonuclease fold toxin [Escherichia coli]